MTLRIILSGYLQEIIIGFLYPQTLKRFLAVFLRRSSGVALLLKGWLSALFLMEPFAFPLQPKKCNTFLFLVMRQAH